MGLIPRRQEGYSTDDQARGIWACLEWLELAEERERPQLLDWLDIYLSFLLGVQREDGHFHNNIAYSRTPEDETPSDDCLGRCLWAGAMAWVTLPEDGRRIAVQEMTVKALGRALDMTSPRGWAYALASASLLHQRGAGPSLQPLIERLSDRMTASYRLHAGPDWRWFEPILSYSNGLLPWGLLCAYEALEREEWLAVSLESLDFLISKCTGENGRIRPIGNRGWCTRERQALWDQQPIDVFKLLLATVQAYDLTGDARYAETANRCRSWYYGNNDAGAVMADAAEGACCDGIGPDGPNRNQGAESTLSYLLMESVYRKWAARHPAAAGGTSLPNSSEAIPCADRRLDEMHTIPT